MTKRDTSPAIPPAIAVAVELVAARPFSVSIKTWLAITEKLPGCYHSYATDIDKLQIVNILDIYNRAYELPASF
jgi:hypothetical protein